MNPVRPVWQTPCENASHQALQAYSKAFMVAMRHACALSNLSVKPGSAMARPTRSIATFWRIAFLGLKRYDVQVRRFLVRGPFIDNTAAIPYRPWHLE